MTSKSELKRLVALNPFDMVEKYHALQEQLTAKDAEIERLKGLCQDYHTACIHLAETARFNSKDEAQDWNV